MEEKTDEKTWDDTEQVVKKAIKEQLGIERDVFIERAHRVGDKLDRHAPNHRHADSASRPTGSHANRGHHRPIVARFRFWKEKENVIREARRKRPNGVQFLNDFARRTLDRRAEKIPEMLEHRRNGKTAFMIMDKLVVYDRPSDRSSSRKRSKAKAYASYGSEEEMMINMYLVQVTQTLLNAYVSTRTLGFLVIQGHFSFILFIQVFEMSCTISQFPNQ